MKTTFAASDLNTHGTICCFATTVTMEPCKSSDSSGLRSHIVQGTNANQAKLEDLAQLAQVIVLVNELREALVGKGLINGFGLGLGSFVFIGCFRETGSSLFLFDNMINIC